MRAVLLFAIVMLSITMANSQCNYFAKIDNSTDPVFHNLIINAPDSNYIVTWINDSTSTNFVVCIAKIDNNGDTLWTRQIGAGCSGRTINLVNVDSFSFAIAGVSLCKDSNGNPIGGACFLYKMSFNGDSLNITKFSINSTSIKRMIMTRDSNFIVAIVCCLSFVLS